MRFTVRSLALISATALTLVGLTVPAASAAPQTSFAITSVSPAVYGASGSTVSVSGTTDTSGGFLSPVTCSATTIAVSVAASTGTPLSATANVDPNTCVWSTTFSTAQARTLPDGTLTASATQSVPGLLGPIVTTRTKTLAKDTYVPPAPSIAALGTNFVINNTNLTGVTATGQAEANSTVTLKLGSLTQTATANASGLWSMFFDASALGADGTYTAILTEAEVGAAHNVGPAATRSIIKDTAAPAKTATSPASGSTVGPPAKVSFTYNKALASNSTINLRTSDGTAVNCPVTVSGSAVSCTPAPALKTGGYTATAGAYDNHGNQTVTSISFTVDATAPTVTNLKSTNTTATATRTTVTGSVSEAATLTVTSTDNTGAKASATLKVTNAAQFKLVVDERTLGGGTITVTVKAVDVYGNASTSTTTHTRTLPAGTSVSLTVPGWSAVGWRITLSGSVHLAKSGAYGSVTLVHASLSGAQQVLATMSVGSNGTYAFTYMPTTSGTYYAIYNAVSGAGAQSPTYSSQVRYAISVSSAKGSAATKAVIGGAVHNPPHGAYVIIYKRNADGSWTQLGKATIDRTYHYRFSVLLPKGSTAIRVTIPSSHGYFSNSANVTATRT